MKTHNGKNRKLYFDDWLQTGVHGCLEFSVNGKSNKRDTFRIKFTRWISESFNNNVIIYNHGLQSHRAWFYPTAEKLTKKGFHVYAFDRIGSGESSNQKISQNESKRGHVSNWTLFVITLQHMVERVHKEFPTSRIVLWGNSFGAKVVTAFLLSDTWAGQWIQAAIFTSPGLFLNKKSMPVPFSMFKLLISSSSALFPTPITANNGNKGAHWFTYDPAWAAHIKNDKLSLRRFSKQFFLQTRAMDRFIASSNKEVLKTIPRMYLLVDRDPMMDNEKLKQHIKSTPDNVTVKEYAGGQDHRHFIAFTADAEKAFEDIIAYLNNLHSS